MKRIYIFIVAVLFILFFDNNYINASFFSIDDKLYAYEINNGIEIYKDNINIDTIGNSVLLDLDDKYVLFNRNDTLYLFDSTNLKEIYIDTGYNALIEDNYVIYENNDNDNYKCKSAITDKTNNCYKLYKYDILTSKKDYVNIIGNDVYLNDFQENLIVYNSIHLRDLICSSMCSFVGVYNLNDDSISIINKYEDISLNISGNGFISEDVIVFETLLNFDDCDTVQLIKYNIDTQIIEVLLNDGMCFNKDLEIIDFDSGYLIFKSNFNNYESNDELMYLYSLNDNKYDEIELNCDYIKVANNELVYLDRKILVYKALDEEKPYLDNTIMYNLLIGKEDKFIKNLVVSDNLTSKDNLKISILSSIIIDNDALDLQICDTFNNCNEYTLRVNIIKSDNEGPRIYLKNRITIKLGDKLNLNDYGYSIDNIDGRVSLYTDNEINYNKSGTYVIIVKSKDSSGNITSKEIELVIYENSLMYRYYFISVLLSISMVVIIYIFRFKKHV